MGAPEVAATLEPYAFDRLVLPRPLADQARCQAPGRAGSRIIIDSMRLGRCLGISDLMVAAPRQESATPPAALPSRDILGLVFSGTPYRPSSLWVSVLVDLSLPRTTARPWLSPPPPSLTVATADQPVPDDKRDGAARLRQQAAQQKLRRSG